MPLELVFNNNISLTSCLFLALATLYLKSLVGQVFCESTMLAPCNIWNLVLRLIRRNALNLTWGTRPADPFKSYSPGQLLGLDLNLLFNFNHNWNQRCAPAAAFAFSGFCLIVVKYIFPNAERMRSPGGRSRRREAIDPCTIS